MVMGLFGLSKKEDPKEAVRNLQRKMRTQLRQIDRQIHGIEREELKVKREIKEAAKKGDRGVCVVLAKSMIQSRKAVTKMHVSKAQINSVVMCMQQQMASMRMAGSMQASTEAMKSMQQLVKVGGDGDQRIWCLQIPEIMGAMREMAQEMMRVGIIEEMMEETMEAMEPEDLEEAAQEEVDKILWEVTAGEMGKAPAAPAHSLVESRAHAQPAVADAVDGVADRFASLRG